MSAPATARELRATQPLDAAATPLRMAALLLHAMTEPDRTWLLAQLPEGERRALGGLVTELRQLGIPADRAVLDEALAVRDVPAPVSAPLTGDEAHIQVLKGADPARLAAILREEPAMVVAQLLELAEWPWRRAVLTRLGAMVRAQVEDAQLERTPPPGKRLRAQLLEAVVRRLAEPASSPSSARPWLRWRGGGRR